MRKIISLLFFCLACHCYSNAQIAISPADTVCTGTDVTFFTTPTDVTYNWDFNAGNISMISPLSFTTPEYLYYFDPDTSYTFATAGTYNISLFKDFGRPTGPSVSCTSIDVKPCSSPSPCLTDSLVINTGYDPVSGLAITPGANGATPVPDPHWVASSISPDVAGAITATPITGLIEVVPGNSAEVITSVYGWAYNPAGNPGAWISCVNANEYWDAGDTSSVYNMTLSRSFRMCSDDSITFNLNIADDNYVSSVNIDGIMLPFSQPPSVAPANYSTYANVAQTIFLTSGTHVINVVTNNYAVNVASENPTGLDLFGSVSSATHTNSVVSESSASCLAYVCGAIIPDTVCNTLHLPDSLYACAGAYETLPATISGPDSVMSILWSPSSGLSDTSLLDPVLTIGTPGWYYLTVESLIPDNLVINGDFSAGNTGFTTAYAYDSIIPPVGISSTPGDYFIGTDPYSYNSAWPVMGDHTTGTGNMLILDGAYTSVSFWCESMTVLPNTNYIFSVWSALLHLPLPDIQVTINGVPTGTFAPTVTEGQWVEYQIIWNSGTDTSADICMTDLSTAGYGNDFAIDDISFQQLCTVEDSIYVAVTAPDTTYAHSDTSVCAGTFGVTLTAPAIYPLCLWSTGNTGSTIGISAGGIYWVEETGSCVLLSDTFHVTYLPVPVVNIGNDTTICAGTTLTLVSPEPQGVNYIWSTGSTDTFINVSDSGSYMLTVNESACSATDSIHVAVNTPPYINLGPDTSLCQGQIYTLLTNTDASYYQWQDGSGGTSLAVTQTGIYWVIASNQCGTASDSASVTLELCDIWFPNAFTPNNDGLNDYAKVGGNLGFFTNFSLSIFNRFGQMVFTTQNIYAGWDGTYNGVKQDLGTYFYLIYYTLEGKQQMMKGDLELIR